VSRALAQPIAERFQTAEEMGSAIEKVMQTLGIVTSHTEVAKFLGRVMKDKLDARKALVANAIEDAKKREQSKSSIEIVVPLASLPSFPAPAESSSGAFPTRPSDASHPGATFAAQNLEAFPPLPPRRNGIAIATMILASLAILSAIGIGAFIYVTRVKPAPPAVVAKAADPLPPPPPPTPSATIASAPAVESAAPVPSTKPAPKAVSATWKPPATNKPAAGKKRDDEAGF
jgi:hypothetical protein